jgi:hypothetical protein
MIADDYYAREADRIARGPQLYGGNAAIVSLRCFKYYHPDQGSWLTNPEGLEKWVGPKTARIYAILHRKGFGGSRTTMSAISSEAMCSRSTVSRGIVRLQALGFLVAEVTRGRNGGVTVRLRTKSDGLKHYAAAAWARIRSWINVASTHKEGSEVVISPEHDPRKVTSNPLLTMDATFSEVPWTFTSRDADLEWVRAERWAEEVIVERRRIDNHEPDWDLQLEKIRASVGWA